jgi:hypothetical protein
MPRFTYVGPFDSVEVPLIRRHVKPGEEFDVTDDQAALLAEQPDNYRPATKARKADTAPEG